MSNDSILDSTKKVLGLDEGYNAFDVDILMHINSVFSTLTQLGVGPEEGYYIEDNNDKWADYLGSKKFLNFVKSYMYLRVRLLFDPPPTSFAISALNEQRLEHEWRIEVAANQDPLNARGPWYDDAFVWEVEDTDPLPAEAEEGDVGFDPDTGNLWRKT